MEANDFNVAMTKPGSSGEMPLPKRQGPRPMYPLSWTGREVAVSYRANGNDVPVVRRTLVDWSVLGVVLTVGGVRTLVNFDAITTIELIND